MLAYAVRSSYSNLDQVDLFHFPFFPTVWHFRHSKSKYGQEKCCHIVLIFLTTVTLIFVLPFFMIQMCWYLTTISGLYIYVVYLSLISSYAYILPLVKEVHQLELRLKQKEEEYEKRLVHYEAARLAQLVLVGKSVIFIDCSLLSSLYCLQSNFCHRTWILCHIF